MLTVTTDSIPGFTVTEALGLAWGCSVRGSNVLRDIGAKMVDFWGGQATGFGKVFEQAISETQQMMVDKAKGLGANAIVGVQGPFVSNYQLGKGGLFEIVMMGTAVKGDFDR